MLSNNTSQQLPPSSGTYEYTVFQPGATGFPTLAGSFTDPVFGGSNSEGSILKRLTADTDTATYGQDIYGHHWANADGTYFFYTTSAGTKQVRAVSDGSVVVSGCPMGNGNDVTWHPTDPDKYFYFSGAYLYEYTVSTTSSAQVNGSAFASSAGALGGTLDFCDATGRWFCVNISGVAKCYDRTLDQVYSGDGGTVPTGGGYAGITGNGKYLITAEGTFTAAAVNSGSTSVSSPFMFWTDGGSHACFISKSDGTDYMVRPENALDGYVYAVKIKDQTGKTQAQQRADPDNFVVISSDWIFDYHLSAPGTGSFVNWAFVSYEWPTDVFDYTPTGSWPVYAQEIVAVNIETLEIRRLCHHRSRSVGVAYDYQPRTSTSWDGSLVFWTSNFNDNDVSGYVDMWGIENPLGAAASPSSTTSGKGVSFSYFR